MKKYIKYISGIKYSLHEDHEFESRITVNSNVYTYFFDIFPKKDGTGSIWHVRRGYPWDGPSGPTIDTLDSMRASLEHDLKYESIRKGLIDKKWRHTADDELKSVCLEDGMNNARVEFWYYSVLEFAESSADPKNERKIITAPKEVKI